MPMDIVFQPDVAWPLIYIAAGFAALMVALAVWRRLPAWWLRAIAMFALLFALTNPSIKEEERESLDDIVFVVIDQTSSQSIDVRPEQMEAALGDLSEEIGRQLSGAKIIEVPVRDGAGSDADRGTLLMTALAKVAAEEASDQIAGAIILSDGQINDPAVLSDFPAPVSLLLTGRADEWDRRIVLETAPSFGIIGEPIEISLRVENLGAVPVSADPIVPLLLSIDGEPPEVVQATVGEQVRLQLQLDHGGQNVIQLTVPTDETELTDRNNSAVVSINGIRDRLRVLLVSGEPHAGERTWRNLLKSDPAVDLVHFTILRPPHKQDGVPVYELSLIAFPTRELFMDKIDEFDLIIFDRYRRRGVLPSLYMENIVRYVKDGGALLVASGPSLAGAESLYRTPLADVLPVAPTAEVIEEPYTPVISELGNRHPVTEGLDQFAPRPSVDGVPGWGRWFRLIDTTVEAGHVVMEGAGKRPLLVVDRPGDGRIAALASDHAWLWSRGVEGGGPQRELLRRLAHWLMKEPELEEEVLSGVSNGLDVVITRRTMSEEVGEVTVTAPDGSTQLLTLDQVAPGQFQAQFPPGENGIYRLSEADKTAVFAVGPAAPKEYENPVSTGDVIKPLLNATRGGMHRLEDGAPDIRAVRAGAAAAGRGWVGLTPREAYNVLDIRLTPLAPGWLMFLISSLAAIMAWRIEGR